MLRPSLVAPEIADQLVQQVIALAQEAVRSGGAPFSSLVADSRGQVLGIGVNTVLRDNDPTAHAEVCAIRDACRRHGRTGLPGTVLICSGEPCAMCYMAALFAGVSEVIFAVSVSEAEAHGYHYGQSHRLLAGFPHAWPFGVRHLPLPGALTPFQSHR